MYVKWDRVGIFHKVEILFALSEAHINRGRSMSMKLFPPAVLKTFLGYMELCVFTSCSYKGLFITRYYSGPTLEGGQGGRSPSYFFMIY